MFRNPRCAWQVQAAWLKAEVTGAEEADEADRSAVELAGVEAAQTAESSAVEETEVAAAAAAPKPEVEAAAAAALEPEVEAEATETLAEAANAFVDRRVPALGVTVPHAAPCCLAPGEPRASSDVKPSPHRPPRS